MTGTSEPSWLWAYFQDDGSEGGRRPMLPIGAKLCARYVLKEFLGAGGFGAVFAAWDTRLGREVSVKVLHLDGGRARGQRQHRALPEARAAARVPHRHVVVVHEVRRISRIEAPDDDDSLGAWVGTPIIVAERLRGASARTQLSAGPRPLHDTLRFLTQLADALAAAHASGIVHGDLKPENIWEEETGDVKLLDFGLARALGSGLAREEELLAGTPGYTPPERSREGPALPAGDVWGLGVVAVELLTGARPSPAWSAPLGAPLALTKLLEDCLSQDPLKRPSARELFVRLCRIREALPDAPSPDEGLSPAVCPFPGLSPFDEESAPFFFGRSADLRGCLDIWSWERPWLLIEGASGAGKSSLVEAGLVPALRRGWMGAVEGVHRVPPRAPEIEGLFAQLQGLAGAQLVVIDGLEEGLLLESDAELHRLDVALDALLGLRQPVLLVTSLRSDFAPRLARLDRCASRLNRQAARYMLRELSGSGLREVIRAPLALSGRPVEPALVDRLVMDTGGSAAGLPLLAYVLRELWGRRPGGALRLSDYASLGSLGGAVGREAEALWSTLSEKQRAGARALFLGLTALDEQGRATRRSLSRDAALQRTGLGSAQAMDLLRALSSPKADGMRLLSVDEVSGEPRVDIVHDALFGAWERLGAWVREAAVTIGARSDLEHAARAWVAAGAPDDGIARGRQLAYFEQAGVVDGAAAELLRRSRARRARLERSARRRWRSLVAGWGLASLLLAALLVWSIEQRRDSERRRRRGVEVAQRLSRDLESGLSEVPGTSGLRGRVLGTVLELVEELDDDPLALESRGALLYQRGRLARARGEHELALESLRAAAQTQRAVLGGDGSASAVLALADTLELLHWEQLTLRDHDAALERAQELTELLQDARSRGTSSEQIELQLAKAYKLRARVHEVERRSDAALALFRRSLEQTRGLEGAAVRDFKASLLASIGNVELIQGRFEDARRSYQFAMALTPDDPERLSSSYGARRSEVWLHLGMGRIELDAGRFEQARSWLLAALRFARSNSGDPGLEPLYGIDLGTVLHELGRAELGLGLWEQAEAHGAESARLAESIEIREPIRHGVIEAQAAQVRAEVRAARGELSDALKMMTDARAALEAAVASASEHQHTTIIMARLLLAQAKLQRRVAREDEAARTRARVVELVSGLVSADPKDAQAARALERARSGAREG